MPSPGMNTPETGYNRRIENRPIQPATPGGWGFGWWWVWLVVVLALFWFAGWGWGPYGGWWGGPARSRTVVVQVSGPGLEILTSPNKKPYVGDSFAITAVPVQNKINNRAYWIGVGNAAPLLVVVPNSTNGLATGDRVNITGTVQKAPPENQAKQDWGLSDEGARRLEEQGAYVQAAQIQR